MIGVIISALFQAGLTLLLYMSDPYSDMLRINYWLMGAFNVSNHSNQKQVVPYAAVLGAFFLLLIDTVVRNLPTGEVPISVSSSCCVVGLLSI
jgi:iron complex transport system permease protein